MMGVERADDDDLRSAFCASGDARQDRTLKAARRKSFLRNAFRNMRKCGLFEVILYRVTPDVRNRYF
jgi:hypothetical protein